LSTFRLPPNVAAARRLRCCDIYKSGVNGLCCFTPRFGANGVFTTSRPKSQSLNIAIKCVQSHIISLLVPDLTGFVGLYIVEGRSVG
jgi:hypothetical protein